MLVADILTNAVYRADGFPRYDTREASIRAYERALRTCGLPDDKAAHMLAKFESDWQQR
jgi:hypothetical protein